MRNQNTRHPYLLFLCVCFVFSIFNSSLPAQPANESAPRPAKSATPKNDVKAATKPQSKKWSFSLLPTAFQRNPLLDFTIVTELTDEGRKLPPPSFERPVYFKAVSVGYHVEGQDYGGEKPMQIEQLQDRLLRALASNGYRPAVKDHPASQTLRLLWGMHNKLNTLDDTFASDSSNTDESDAAVDDYNPNSLNLGSGYKISNENAANIMSRAKIVGGTKFAQDMGAAIREQASSSLRGAMGPFNRFIQRDDVTESLVDQTFNDCYYLIVQSFDTRALETDRTKKLLWQTNMTTAAQGVSLDQTMPGLIENGAYFFGRETKIPQIVTKRAVKSGRVDIGEATVEGYIDTPSGTTKPAATGTTPPAQKNN